jgi:tetratricopeptide (TPR) repeat protein
MSGFELRTVGLLFEAVRSRAELENEEYHEEVWNRYRWRPETFDERHRDFSADMILADYHYARGRRELLFGRKSTALLELKKAEEYGFGIKEIHNNLGGALAEAGEPRAALGFLRHAIEVDPQYDLAILNVANCYFALGLYADGLPWFELALKLRPRNPLFELGRARGHKDRGELNLARLLYLGLLWQAPRDEALKEEVRDFLTKTWGERGLKEMAFLENETRAPEKPSEEPASAEVEDLLDDFPYPGVPTHPSPRGHSGSMRPGRPGVLPRGPSDPLAPLYESPDHPAGHP